MKAKSGSTGPPERFLTDNKINFIIRLPKASYKADISAGGKAYSALLN